MSDCKKRFEIEFHLAGTTKLMTTGASLDYDIDPSVMVKMLRFLEIRWFKTKQKFCLGEVWPGCIKKLVSLPIGPSCVAHNNILHCQRD